MNTYEKTLQQFRDYLQEMNYYIRINHLINWDLQTTTPKQGYDQMADALTYFSGKEFEMATSDELFALLEGLSQPDAFEQLDDVMRFTVRKMKEEIDKDRRIPKDFQMEFVAHQSASLKAWLEAKQKADFSIYAPYLEKMIELVKTRCGYTDPGKEVYEVLLDQYEKGMDRETIERIFSEYKEGILPLIRQVLEREQPDDSKFRRYYDPDHQRKVEQLLLDYIGLKKECRATAQTEHPFTDGFSSGDVRVTNHFHEHDPLAAIFSAIHEGGHGIFQQNTDSKLDGTPGGDCSYMGIHESQSRFYENILGRNKNFWIPIYEKVQELMPELQDVSLEEFYREINHVRNSMIRIDADELTYGLHVILRFEVEQAIFREQVPVRELPALWNRKMQEYLQITPANDAEGILQDVHWTDGSFGYFPSYLLGTIYDGMFLEAMQQDLGNIDQVLAEGRISEITAWLKEKIHQFGGTKEPKQVLMDVCGKEADAKPILEYFYKKYSK